MLIKMHILYHFFFSFNFLKIGPLVISNFHSLVIYYSRVINKPPYVYNSTLFVDFNLIDVKLRKYFLINSTYL